MCRSACFSMCSVFVHAITSRVSTSFWWVPLSLRWLDDSSAAARDCSANHVGLSFVILHFSTDKSSLQADQDNPSPPSSPLRDMRSWMINAQTLIQISYRITRQLHIYGKAIDPSAVTCRRLQYSGFLWSTKENSIETHPTIFGHSFIWGFFNTSNNLSISSSW